MADKKSLLIFAETPDFSKLCCLNLYFPNKNDSSAHQAHIIKCRELIFTETDIIASPYYEDDSFIQIIMPQSLYKTGRLQTRFKKQGLQASNPLRVLPDVYKACVSYTMLAKLAPSWNKAGQWLIQGRDFLTNGGVMNAVKLNVNVTNNDMYFEIQASALRLPPAQVCDFGMCGASYFDYLMTQDGRISENQLQYAWCHVLPSMKKGRVIEISRTMPRDSVFDTYRDLKRFWKNNYGYRLPDKDTDITYYQVHFLPIPEVNFTYPNVCIRSRDFLTLHRIDGRPILQTFLQDLMGKVQQVCGQSLKILPKVHQPFAALNPAIQDNSQANLKNRTINKKVPLRDPYQLQKIYENKDALIKTSENSGIIDINGQDGSMETSRKNKLSSNDMLENISIAKSNVSTNNMSANNVSANNVSANNVSVNNVSASQNTAPAMKKNGKIVPVFKAKCFSQTSKPVSANTSRKVVPNFTTKSKPDFSKTQPKVKSLSFQHKINNAKSSDSSYTGGIDSANNDSINASKKIENIATKSRKINKDKTNYVVFEQFETVGKNKPAKINTPLLTNRNPSTATINQSKPCFNVEEDDDFEICGSTGVNRFLHSAQYTDIGQDMSKKKRPNKSEDTNSQVIKKPRQRAKKTANKDKGISLKSPANQKAVLLTHEA